MKIKSISTKYLPISDLKPAPYNPRKISRREMDKLVNSIRYYGFVDPVIVQATTLQIIGGHQRVLAAQELNLDKVPCILIDLSDTDAKTLNLALNKISGEWDFPKLREILSELQDKDIDTILAGFDFGDIQTAFAGIDAPPEIDLSDELSLKHNYLVFYFDPEETSAFDRVIKHFKLTKKRSNTLRGQVGLGRVLPGSKILNLIDRLSSND